MFLEVRVASYIHTHGQYLPTFVCHYAVHKMSSPQDGSPREMICNEGSASSQATSVESKSGYVTVVLVVAAAGSRTDSLVQTQRTPGRCDVIN